MQPTDKATESLETVKGSEKRMDLRAREIIGLPVVTYNRGSKIYDVEDLLLDPDRRQVLALLVEEKAIFHAARAVPFGRINAIGPDAVIVPDGKAVIDVDRDQLLKSLYNDRTVRNLRVITDDGRKLGTVEDMLIDAKTGEIRGYYVTLGMMRTMGQGTRWLPVESVLSMGQRVLFVSPTVADDFTAQSGGWTGALDQAGDTVRSAGSKANEALLNVGDKTKEGGGKLNEQLGLLGNQVREGLPQQAGSMAVGRTAHNAVTLPDGSTLLAEGEMITQEHVETARREGRMPQLLIASGMGPVRQEMDSFGREAGQSFTEMRTEARSLWDQLTGRYGQSVDVADERLMERRIKNALGRPASRVILDTDDNVILNTGDIITNRAVEAAQAAGVLDILVDSVYTEKPTLSLEDLKAPVNAGHASLKNSRASARAGSTPAAAATAATATTATTATTAATATTKHTGKADTLPEERA
jgi:uncharacterized protein YrrD